VPQPQMPAAAAPRGPQKAKKYRLNLQQPPGPAMPPHQAPPCPPPLLRLLPPWSNFLRDRANSNYSRRCQHQELRMSKQIKMAAVRAVVIANAQPTPPQ
jgi:hypothetical protein